MPNIPKVKAAVGYVNITGYLFPNYQQLEAVFWFLPILLEFCFRLIKQ
jgi:hypothetical protein